MRQQMLARDSAFVEVLTKNKNVACFRMAAEINYEEMLCIDGTGWDVNLFENLNNIELFLCKSCGNVCRDAAELGCDHDDELIDIYCHKCLDKEKQKYNMRFFLF